MIDISAFQQLEEEAHQNLAKVLAELHKAKDVITVQCLRPSDREELNLVVGDNGTLGVFPNMDYDPERKTFVCELIFAVKLLNGHYPIPLGTFSLRPQMGRWHGAIWLDWDATKLIQNVQDKLPK